MRSPTTSTRRAGRPVGLVLGALLVAATLVGVGSFGADAEERGAAAPAVLGAPTGTTLSPGSVTADAASRSPTPLASAEPTALAAPPELPRGPVRGARRVLRVVVVEAGGDTPVPDAHVRVSHWAQLGEEPRLVESGATDDSGERRFHVAPGVFSVVAFRPGESFARATVDVSAAAAQHTLRVELDPDHALHGVVRDGDGRPLADVIVRSLAASPARQRPQDLDAALLPTTDERTDTEFVSRTDAAGCFAAPWWLVDAKTALLFDRDGHGSERLDWEFDEGSWWAVTADARTRFTAATDELEVVMHAERSVQGVVVDAGGAPVLRAGVWLRPRQQPSGRAPAAGFRGPQEHSALTDLLGRFVLEGLRSDAPFVLAVGSEGRGDAVLEVPPGGDADLGVIRLSGEVSVTGRVVDGDGAPLDGVGVALVPAYAPAAVFSEWDDERRSEWLVDPDSARWGTLGVGGLATDADGRFELRGAALDGQRLRVRRHGSVVRVLALDLGDGPVDLGDIVVREGVDMFSGRVLDLDGGPMAHMLLQVRDDEEELRATVTLDAGGRFSFAMAPGTSAPSTLQLTLLRAGNTAWPPRTFVPSDFPVNLRVDRGLADR